MTRPHPVIRIGSELSDRRRRSTHHTNILIHRLDKQVILVGSVERLQFEDGKIVCLDIFFLGKTLGNRRQVRRRKVIQSFRIIILFQLFLHIVRHIENTVDKRNGQSLTRKFFRTAHRPETIGQIIVFHRTVLLDILIPTVMIGQHQSFGRNNLSGTSTPKMHNCIFQADTVGTIHLVDADIQTQILHDGSILFLQIGQHPHALVGISGERACGKHGK